MWPVAESPLVQARSERAAAPAKGRHLKRPSGDSDDRGARLDVSDHNGTCTNDAVVAQRHARDDARSSADGCPSAHVDTSGEVDAGRERCKTADAYVVADGAANIHVHSVGESHVRREDRPGIDHTAVLHRDVRA